VPALAARSAPQLRAVGVEDQAVVLHLLSNRREDLVAMRTQTINRLHRLLVDLVPAGAVAGKVMGCRVGATAPSRVA
jgi:transposase